MDASPSPQANTRLRQARIACNWRQRDLAEQLGTTVISIRRWERGSHQPGAYYRIKLCALFGMSSQELGLIADEPNEELGEQKQHTEDMDPTFPEHVPVALPLHTPIDLDRTLVYPKKKPNAIPAFLGTFGWTGQRRRTYMLIGVGIVLLVLVLGSVLWTVDRGSFLSTTAIATPGAASRIAGPASIDPQSIVDPYGPDSTLALSDDLTSATPNLSQWDVSSQGNAHGCFFRQHTYDVLLQGLGYCVANNSNLANFVYQIQLTIIHGQAAGIIFRTNDNAAQTYYIFEMTVDGHFFVQRNDSSEDDTLLSEGNNAAIKTGFHQLNTIAVDANGGEMTFYINGKVMTHLIDSQYSSGLIGVIVGEQFNTQDIHTITEATYNDVRVWV